MKIWQAREILAPITFWLKPALSVNADAVDIAFLIKVYIYTKCMQVAKALVMLHNYTC